MNEEDHTTTTTLRRIAPAWAWLRENFRLPAVLTIAGVLIGWAADRFSLSARVSVLEDHWHTIEKTAAVTTQVAVQNQRIDDLGERVGSLEKDWNDARNAAALPPLTHPHPPRRPR